MTYKTAGRKYSLSPSAIRTMSPARRPRLPGGRARRMATTPPECLAIDLLIPVCVFVSCASMDVKRPFLLLKSLLPALCVLLASVGISIASSIGYRIFDRLLKHHLINWYLYRLFTQFLPSEIPLTFAEIVKISVINFRPSDLTPKIEGILK